MKDYRIDIYFCKNKLVRKHSFYIRQTIKGEIVLIDNAIQQLFEINVMVDRVTKVNNINLKQSVFQFEGYLPCYVIRRSVYWLVLLAMHSNEKKL